MGASGNTGGRISEQLLQQGEKVRALGRSSQRLALSPSYSTAHHWYAQLLVSLRRHQEAATHMELARSVDPASPAINAYLPYIYLAARDYPRAVQEAIVAVELERA